MNKQTEALKMAVEALEWIRYGERTNKQLEAIEACKEALEQPAQEPFDVARVQEDGYVEWREGYEDLPVGTKLYTRPAPSWQGLSDDKINVIWDDVSDVLGFAKAIEAELKEKNAK